jgi:hypothetical protein
VGIKPERPTVVICKVISGLSDVSKAVASDSEQDGKRQGEENQNNDLPSTFVYLCDHRLSHTTWRVEHSIIRRLGAPLAQDCAHPCA